MSTSRRKFLKLSALAGGSVGAGLIPGLNVLGNSANMISPAPKPLSILILGGTGFTGPFQVKYALDRGHKVTVFNRGKTHPGELDKRAEQLLGDRNGQLDALKERKWDVCIDIPTTLPVWVRDAAQILKGNVDRYIFISTISVFSDNSKPNMDESGPLAEYKGPDAMAETQPRAGQQEGGARDEGRQRQAHDDHGQRDAAHGFVHEAPAASCESPAARQPSASVAAAMPAMAAQNNPSRYGMPCAKSATTAATAAPAMAGRVTSAGPTSATRASVPVNSRPHCVGT